MDWKLWFFSCDENGKVLDWMNLDSELYINENNAAKGHDKMVEKMERYVTGMVYVNKEGTMITLKELVQEQAWNNATDLQIIKAYFELNDLESDGIDIISELTKSKINKIKNKYEIAETWVCMLPSKYLYETYSLDIADHLHRLELDYLMNGCELSDKQLKWAKENVPNIKMPECYFQPLVRWLEQKEISFKEK